MPVTSPPTKVFTYSAAYFSIREMVKAGLCMTLASSACGGLSV